MQHISLVLPRVTEELHVMRVKPCACGGQVRADVRFPTQGVDRHNRTKRHLAWRAAQGYDAR